MKLNIAFSAIAASRLHCTYIHIRCENIDVHYVAEDRRFVSFVYKIQFTRGTKNERKRKKKIIHFESEEFQEKDKKKKKKKGEKRDEEKAAVYIRTR